MMADINVLIDRVVTKTKDTVWLPECRNTVSDADALGVAVSKWAEWDGNQIAETFFAALEDANYHTERKKMIELWNASTGSDLH